MNYIQLVVSVCAALAILIPLGVKLYRTSEQLIHQKNWPRLVAAVSKYMEEAERLFSEGADKKAWVLTMIQSTADQLDYILTAEDMNKLSELIDILCDMSKVVNVKVDNKADNKKSGNSMGGSATRKDIIA